jgi:cytochrome P450
MTRSEIAENAKLLILAGSETTATLLSGVTFQLLTNPNKYENLVKEIRSSFTSEQEITIARVNQLRYIIAAFSEGSRMCKSAELS